MDELLIVLCFLLFAAVVVTLVGHGMWVLVGAIFGSLFGGDKPENKRVCIKCGRSTSLETPGCDWCGALHVAPLQNDPTKTAARDHKTFLRQLKQLRDAGVIDGKTAEEIARGAVAYHRRSQPAKQKKAPEVVAAEIVEEHRAERPQAVSPTRPPTPKPAFRGDSLSTETPDEKRPAAKQATGKKTTGKKSLPGSTTKPVERPKPRSLQPRPPREKTPLAAKPVEKPAPAPAV
ncbi:MAG: hypothetical protein U9N87_12690, partial [Planctomycetota bacterium]|nr:hypothetical protein [Planctomycetota bacterium]